MSTKSIIRTFKKHKRFLISTHVNADPDALCSELAMSLYLRSIGKTVTIVNDGAVPRRFHFLPGARSIKKYSGRMHVNFDVAIVLDCGDLERIGKVSELITKDKIIINIDHHVTNDRFGNLNLVKVKSSSTGEVLYELLKRAKCTFSKKLAMHLYIGIMTDTGSFRFENTSSRTHAIAADLMRFKFSVPDLYRRLYETISTKDLKAFTHLIRCFDLHFKKKAVSIVLNKKTVAQFSDEFDLRDTIFKFLRSMKGVEVIIIFSEVSSGQTRINLRSSGTYDVAKLANRFNGGGHQRASGCMIDKNIAGAKRELLNVIRREL